MRASYATFPHLLCARLTLPGREMLLPPLSSKRVYVAGPQTEAALAANAAEAAAAATAGAGENMPTRDKSPISCAHTA